MIVSNKTEADAIWKVLRAILAVEGFDVMAVPPTGCFS